MKLIAAKIPADYSAHTSPRNTSHEEHDSLRDTLDRFHKETKRTGKKSNS